MAATGFVGGVGVEMITVSRDTVQGAVPANDVARDASAPVFSDVSGEVSAEWLAAQWAYLRSLHPEIRALELPVVVAPCTAPRVAAEHDPNRGELRIAPHVARRGRWAASLAMLHAAVRAAEVATREADRFFDRVPMARRPWARFAEVANTIGARYGWAPVRARTIGYERAEQWPWCVARPDDAQPVARAAGRGGAR